MDYDVLHRRLAKRADSGLDIHVGLPASVDAIARTQERLGVSFPSAVRDMFLSFDGLRIEHAAFAIHALKDVSRHADLVVFSVCDRIHRLAFDIREINEAGEWYIVNDRTGYRVTFTVASLLSTRMWTWVEQHRPIWCDTYDKHVAE